MARIWDRVSVSLACVDLPVVLYRSEFKQCFFLLEKGTTFFSDPVYSRLKIRIVNTNAEFKVYDNPNDS